MSAFPCKSFKTLLNLCFLMILSNLVFLGNAHAVCVQTTGSYSISGTINGCYSWYTGSVTVESGASITSSSPDAFATTNTTSGNALGSFVNNGSITAGSGYAVINNQPGGGTISSITNNGSMSNSGTSANIFIYDSTLTVLTNNGSITQTNAVNNNAAIEVGGPGWGGIGAIATLTNGANGVVNSVGGAGVGVIGGGVITSLINQGIISATDSGSYAGIGIAVAGSSTINTITNIGAIYSVGANAYGIGSYGTIGTLNNYQGGNSSSRLTTALSLDGNLPTNYNIGISSSSHYGQLVVTYPVGTITNFGIYGTPFVTSRTYSSVLSGTALPSGTSSGTYDNMRWSLVASGTNIYNLVFTGASLMGTQQSLVNTANSLAPVYAMQNAVLVNSFTYDCTLFDVNNICISVGGRNTQVSAANGLNNTSALLIAAYRPHPNYRIGAYADQNLSVNNAGSTVNLTNSTPLIGIFGAWAQNPEGTGAEVRVSAAYGQKDATITRQVVGLSEPGSGSSTLNSQGAQVTAKYGFGIMDKVIVSPYVGMRYTQNNMNGYTEGSSATVTAPLTYSALNTNATTVLAGVGASYQIIPTVTTFASAGVETDTNTSNGTYSATGINGLTPVNFNPNPVKTRPTAAVGAHYDIAKNQRFGVTGIYRQEAYQAVSSTTVMATYTIGL